MKHARKRVVSRLAATAVASGLIAGGALAAAGSAVAEQNPRSGGATAVNEGLQVQDGVNVTHNGETDTYRAGLFYLTADDGGTLKTYCIDFATGAQTGAMYKETSWESSTLHGNPDAGKIHWILQNSFPAVNDLASLAGQAGAESLNEEQAAAGTQAAIWELSDGVDAVPTNENAAKLTDWLLENAGEVAEPGASLELTPPQVSGQPGEIVGPVTVNSSAESVFVTPDASATEQGVTIVDVNGEYITEDQPVSGGTELYFSIPEDAADGSASLTATATSQVPLGRAFTGIDTRTQTMILAGSSDSSVTANASVSWAAPGQPAVAVNAVEKCVEGGVEITASNEGDVPFAFELDGESYEIAAGESQSVVVPVENGQAYEITIDNAIEGAEPWVFTGVLDCETGDDGGQEQVNEPAPASTGGEGEDGADLAETGSSGGSPMLIGGIAVALLVVGGGVVFFMRRRSAAAGQ
ncbi:LPXTG-motif cell wall anchor domain-containing protein/TQXA domain-containing protein [Streptomyces zhaozhouensis]|uniref:LPXTG-motif cell wall anchor domain-containing protein/TQXA domain-containing protein n=1 Tax=Streptomyces zhaozhouensis TaxID=1300267 RepID=A0A286E5T3_9ACTN|nr:thioester domain-containing protein [Streptomyces zhaozhouensis]SOD66262.1 LPXTG-motif cell wall anchor domain-containing protein/TQXA domain-containing protein [Streptomyces zhaozhouensis]